MPRDASGQFYLTPGTEAVKNDIAYSAHVNQRFEDLAADQNLARPVQAGGTGASSALEARKNLGAAPSDTANVDRAADASKLGGIEAEKYLTREKAQGLNVIGAFAFLACSEEVAYGNLKSASKLQVSGITATGARHVGAAALNGTWKALGACPAGGATLFTKVSN